MYRVGVKTIVVVEQKIRLDYLSFAREKNNKLHWLHNFANLSGVRVSFTRRRRRPAAPFLDNVENPRNIDIQLVVLWFWIFVW